MSRSDVLYRLADAVQRALPPGPFLALADGLSDVRWRFAERDRRHSSMNLSMVLGRPIAQDAVEVREVFRHFGRYLAEFLAAPRWLGSTLRVEGLEPLQCALFDANAASLKGGVIVLTGHIGNWEVGAMAIRQLGWPMTVLALPHADPKVNAFFNRKRRHFGIEVIQTGSSAFRQCATALRRGSILGLVGDRDFGGTGIELPLFDHRVRMPRGPALLSLLTGSPIVPVVVAREGPWRLRFVLGETIHPPQTGRRKRSAPPVAWAGEAAPREDHAHAEAVKNLVAAYVNFLEQGIRTYPTQWLMLQPFVQEQARE